MQLEQHTSWKKVSIFRQVPVHRCGRTSMAKCILPVDNCPWDECNTTMKRYLFLWMSIPSMCAMQTYAQGISRTPACQPTTKVSMNIGILDSDYLPAYSLKVLMAESLGQFKRISTWQETWNSLMQATRCNNPLLLVTWLALFFHQNLTLHFSSVSWPTPPSLCGLLKCRPLPSFSYFSSVHLAT